MRGLKSLGVALVAVLVLPLAWAQSGDWTDETGGLLHKEGFVDLYLDAEGGRILAALPAPDEDGVALRAIQATGLTAGLGSNPIGLDRGRANGGEIVAFRKVGDKLVAEIENWAYRASADNPLERKAASRIIQLGKRKRAPLANSRFSGSRSKAAASMRLSWR